MSQSSDPSAGVPNRITCHQAPPRPMSLQDRAVAAALVATLQLVNRVLLDRSFGELLEAQGYDAEEMHSGLTLHASAEEAFGVCQQALGDLDRAQAAFDSAWEDAREEYVEFRWIVRREFPDPYTQHVLQVVGGVSDDLHEFIAQAAVSYRTAQMLKPERSLEAHGFGLERIQEALAQLRRVARLELALRVSRSRSERQRDERDLAVAMLNLWMRDFHRAARGALGDTSRPPAAAPPPRTRKPRVTRVVRDFRCPRPTSRFALRFPSARG